MDWKIDKIYEKPEKCNNLRLTKYTPIIPFEPIVIHKNWWDCQTTNYQELLFNTFPNLIVENFMLPHVTFIETDNYWKFLKLYKEQFRFEKYAHIFECVDILLLSEKDLEILLELCVEMQSLEIKRNVKQYDCDKFSDEFINQITKILEKYDGVFVKTNIKSGKHYSKIFPSYTIIDVLTNLVFSKEVLQSLLCDGPNYLVFREWNNNISSTNEFRIFIKNKQVQAASQQFMNKPILLDDPLIVINAATVIWQQIKNTIDYNDCVLDIYVKDESNYGLIEINSGNSWSTAGSALFDWDELHNMSDKCFRYLIEKND